MRKIRQIIKEEVSDPFTSVPNDILFDFLQEFEGEYDRKKAIQFCKYLNVSSFEENLSFFDELINLNSHVTSPENIVKPKRKEFEVIFEIKEKLWVKYETVTNTFGYNENSVREQVDSGHISAFDGDEKSGSREVYDSDFIDESVFISEI
jgi:hypothetical protein